MTDNTNSTDAQLTAAPNPALKSLDVLVGTWDVSGDNISGQVRFEWLAGGFFLVQHTDMIHDGRPIKGMEIIGFEKGWEAMMGDPTYTPNPDITSYQFDNAGYVLRYTWEIEGDTLTIWGGPKGSPAYYQGKFSADFRINSGRWVWPGGGYASAMTRIK